MIERTESPIRLFVDFDGTVTLSDVGDGIFKRFLPRELVEDGWLEQSLADWKAGLISSRECLTTQCGRTEVAEPEFREEIDRYVLRPGFAKMAEYCRRQGVPLMILSDGLDYYIEYILTKFDLSDIPFRANHMNFTDGVLGVDFPYMDRGCGRCGNCKRWHMDTLCRNGETIVYVGDGYSDRYAVHNAHTVFARDDLAEYCESNDVDYTHFEDFHTVIRYLESMNGKAAL